MKIYTKKGDSGETSLFGGTRVPKSNERIEAYGTVDELNSFIGLAASYELSESGTKYLRKVQELLFTLGADLATPPSSQTRIDRISADDVSFLEDAIDTLEENLESLKNFVLPGGSQPGATLHIARTICRRAERATVKCANVDDISDNCIKFLNRLSDFLFVIARYENKHAGVREETWKGKQ
ncbi:cob(I)yrinic acid a,c-diamide adenosyltransferase [Fodinibius sp. SL11]|uniref:cob(I)yrinic acid a,c-diamide adenosyltransferase n=1 Tax=Fodinibius sp. SL11 TaxID=3425690 RepID=UPI003F881CF3